MCFIICPNAQKQSRQPYLHGKRSNIDVFVRPRTHRSWGKEHVLTELLGLAVKRVAGQLDAGGRYSSTGLLRFLPI